MSDTFNTRALRAIPLLLLVPIMLRAITFTIPMGDLIRSMRQRGLLSLHGVEAPLLTSFYNVPVLDTVLAEMTAAFALLQMYPVDPWAYWHALIFLTEYAGVYAVLLLESCRGSNEGSLFQFPFLLAFFGQFIPIGILSPIYLFFAYVLSPPQKFASPAARAISPVHAVAVLPTIVLAYYVPHFPCFFHESHAARNWWNWVWQLYPVWGSAMFFIWTKILAVGVASKSSRSIIRPSLSVLAAINTATYWYTIYNSEVPLAEVYIPKYFIHAPVDPVVAMRTIIQYDYICCFSAALLWLAFLIRDLKASGEVKLSWVVILGLTVVVSGVCGAGTMLLLGWAWRDEVLAKGADETAKNK